MAEQAAAEEWLPPGWTAEIRVRMTGKKDRRYFNPEGRKFNSKPEVLRFLKSTESVPESEGKRSSRHNRPSVDSPSEAERVSLADNGTNGQKINNKSLKGTDTSKDGKMLESCADQNAAVDGKETSVLDQKEKSKSTNGEYDSAIVPEAHPLNMPEVDKTRNERLQIGKTISKNHYKKPDLPRRTSKRLAGVEVGPIPELSPANKTRRLSARRVDDTDAATAKSSLDNTKSTPTKDTKHGCSSEGSSMPKEANLQVEANNVKSNSMAGILEVPLPDLWKDPCIEFAIKTLTGQIPIEEVLGTNKAPAKVPEPSMNLPSGDLWGDPCIDFAVKTLTGDIQVADFSIQSYFQKKDKGSDLGLGSSSVSNPNASLTSGSPNGNASLLKAGSLNQPHREGRERGKDRRQQTIRL